MTDVATAAATTRAYVLVPDEEAYARAAAEVDRLERALPILTGGDAAAGLLELPVTKEHDPRSWQGELWCDDLSLRAAALVLARATGRPLHLGPIDEAMEAARTTPVTVVTRPAEITPERLATVHHDATIGWLAARDLAATTRLIARTVLHGPAVMAALDDISFDTITDHDPAPGWLTGDQLTPAGLRAGLAGGVAVLAGRGHARGCLMHLAGGGICGRQHELPLLTIQPAMTSGWVDHPTACQQGPRCHRDDVEVTDHLRAADIRAAFTVLDSCRTAVAGAARVRVDVSIPLSMVEGHALAVCAAVGVRDGAGHVAQLFRALLRAGASLGTATAEMNGSIAADLSAGGRLALFGDAGLVPAPADRDPVEAMASLDERDGVDVPAGNTALLVPGRDLLAAAQDGPLVVPRSRDSSSWVLTTAVGRSGGWIEQAPGYLDERWTARVRPWLDRLRGLGSLGMSVATAEVDAAHRLAAGAVRDRAVAADLGAARAAANAFADAERALTDLQFRLVDNEVRWAAKTYYSLVDGWPAPVRLVGDEELYECPQCGGRCAIAQRLRSAGGAGGPVLRSDVCLRCGEVVAGVAEFPARVTVTSPSESRLGDTFDAEVTIEAPADQPLTIAVGAAFVHEERFNCRMLDSRSLRMEPGARTTITFVGGSDPGLTIPDAHYFKVLLAADGAVRCLTRTVVFRV
ncbi:hypothetical protein [Actinokineospora xionganensis]|uniref:Uncharacterized protein n=1 Tax=Actinokineospora xionganensis TaxID=2684470 RepID=A0ABR7L0F8_9PSEU|nr:hypothetical protein [Actinokineospora xionganensis]MBC6446003.1 hypothetical protein [Actinokineospora xionganensis]